MNGVLIFGGSRGIGAACAESFRNIGCPVVFTYNKSEEKARELEGKTGAKGIFCEVENPDSVKAAVEFAENTLGGIHTLVCCAGIAHIAQVCDVTDERWNSLLGVNLSGTFYACREASRWMVRRHEGKIITVGSVWGAVGASCEAAYSATKAGIRGLTMALSKELAPSGITVNCVEPGVIDTDMNSCLSAEDKEALCEDIPFGRFGRADEVASLIRFLASDSAQYITGQCIGIGGGFGM